MAAPHSKWRKEYEYWCNSPIVRDAFRQPPVVTHSDSFTKHPPPEDQFKSYPGLRIRGFLNTHLERLERDLDAFELIDLKCLLVMLMDITRDLYNTRHRLAAELNEAIKACESSKDWQRKNDDHRRSELTFLKVAHIDAGHAWYLLTPIEWRKKYTGLKHSEWVNVSEFDMAKVKRYMIHFAEDRQHLIWHVSELRKVVTIVTEDLKNT